MQPIPLKDTYKSIAGRAEGLFKDNGSRFIALAYPVETEDEVKAMVEGLKKEYHDARHHCYAYRLGLDGGRWRANDDGEPSGTAGRPILGAIDSAGLSDVLVVVVRYFGGMLLGVPGLIRAYREAAADALAKAEVVWKYASERMELVFDYACMNDVQGLLKSERGVEVAEREFDSICRIVIDVRLSAKDEFLKNIINNFFIYFFH